MEPTRPRFTYLINENILLDRTADRCLQPVIFLSRLLLGDKSVKVYKIGSNGKIKDDLPSSNQTSIIHTCCMCILSSIALIPGILVGGGLKWWSYCTPQHKKDCDLLDKFLIENDSKDKKKDVILNTTNSTTTPLSISSIPATLPIESIIKAEIKPIIVSETEITVNQPETDQELYLKTDSLSRVGNSATFIRSSKKHVSTSYDPEITDPSRLSSSDEIMKIAQKLTDQVPAIPIIPENCSDPSQPTEESSKTVNIPPDAEEVIPGQVVTLTTSHTQTKTNPIHQESVKEFEKITGLKNRNITSFPNLNNESNAAPKQEKATFINSSKQDGSTSCDPEVTDPSRSSSSDEIMKIAEKSKKSQLTVQLRSFLKSIKPDEGLTFRMIKIANDEVDKLFSVIVATFSKQLKINRKRLKQQ